MMASPPNKHKCFTGYMIIEMINYTIILSRTGSTKNNKNMDKLNNLAPITKYLRFKNQGSPEATHVPFAPALNFKNGLSPKLL